MANIFTPKDCHTLINLVVKEATGQDNTINVIDTSSFVASAETVMATGTENVLNSLGAVVGRILMDARAYKGKIRNIQALNTGTFTSIVKKISYYTRETTFAGNVNTDLKTNLAMGYDNNTNGGNSTMSQWEQSQPVTLELNFMGSNAWQYPITIYDYQLKTAFRNESEFGSFVTGIMTEVNNDIETQKESKNRLALLNYMAGLYDYSATLGTAINFTKEFNDKFGTSYTSEELRGVYQSDFMKFFIAYVKTLSDKLTNRSLKYHWSPAKTVNGVNYNLLRHTPKDKQKLMLYQPFFNEAQTQVLSEVFNPQYLKIENYEGVDFWQNELEPAKIDVTPAVTDINTQSATYGTKIAGSRVQLPYVLGVMFDTDALMVDHQLESADTTAKEARKHYRNIWWSFMFNVLCDPTHNGVLFYMAD